MRTPTLLAVLCASIVSACGSAHGPPGTTPLADGRSGNEPEPQPGLIAMSPPRSLDAGLAAVGLTRLEPTVISREMSHLIPEGPRVEGRRITVNVSAGWNQSPPLFAHRANGDVVLVDSRPTVIVDRHVPGGCRGFVGGRAWFETIVYELPEGTRYAGSEVVTWESHVEVTDWTDTQADGSPCPPPALD